MSTAILSKSGCIVPRTFSLLSEKVINKCIRCLGVTAAGGLPNITSKFHTNPPTFHSFNNNVLHFRQQLLLSTPNSTFASQYRTKFNKTKSKSASKQLPADDDDSYDLADFDEAADGKDNKITKYKVTSLRTDLVIKQGLGMARNKVEAAFYDSKIRVNGKKIIKKASSVKVGDEIDVIKDVSPLNPENLLVSRIEILSVIPNESDITVVMRRYKTLTIENYPSENAWKSHTTTP